MDQVVVENVNHPGQTGRVDAAKYAAMKAALEAVVPAEPPGLTFAELKVEVLPHLSERHFPGGAKAGWWAKTVQLDLEAKGQLVRTDGKPLRWFRATS